MKKNIFFLLFTVISYKTLGQEVIRSEQKCIPDYKDINNLGGKFQVKNFKNDTTYLDFWTYGPCNSTFKISVKNLPEHNAVDLEVKNVSEQIPDKNCFCMFILDPVIIGIDAPKSKAWSIRNQTMSRDAWEKWFWDKL